MMVTYSDRTTSVVVDVCRDGQMTAAKSEMILYLYTSVRVTENSPEHCRPLHKCIERYDS